MQTFESQPTGSHSGPEPSDRTRDALDCTASAVASTGAGDIFEVLVSGVTRVLGVDLAFVGILADGGVDVVAPSPSATAAGCSPTSSMPSAARPASMLGQRFRYHAEGIQTLFPDPHVKAIGGVGYSAIPLSTPAVDPWG